MSSNYDGIGLFSGGLDGLLAIKLLEEQGLKIKPLHFFSPFFGHPRNRAYWKRTYGLDVTMVDIGEEFAKMLAKGPTYGTGKVLNPCVDCKILLFTYAHKLMVKYGAKFIASGEVVGQRPMSQRRDTLNVISRDAHIRDVLLRPLSALCLNPTPVEESGLVDRSRLLGFWGRGRKEQFALAAKYGIIKIPTPAGGCLLTERENARRFWPIFKYLTLPEAKHFYLANLGRQYWQGPYWLTVGRHIRDNDAMEAFYEPTDVSFKLKNFPGPHGLGRKLTDEPWPEDYIYNAAALLASFSPKAVQAAEQGLPVLVEVRLGGTVGNFEQEGETRELEVVPQRQNSWQELSWEETGPEVKKRFKTPAQPASVKLPPFKTGSHNNFSPE